MRLASPESVLVIVQLGFAPTQNMEIARADAIVDCLDDLLSRAVNMHYYEKDEEKKVM